jgi:pyrroloquinoline quinone biosynthesis protein D
MTNGAEPIMGERLRRQESVITQQVEEQTILLRADDGGYYAVDEVGAAVWGLCDGNRSVAEIVAALSAEFDASEETIRGDVLEFIEDLRRERLLVDAGA